AIADADRMRLGASYAMWLVYLGLASLRLGRVDDARRAGETALERARRQDERGHAAWAFYLLASTEAAPSPGADDSEKAFRRAIDVAQSLGMRPLLTHCYAGLSETLIRPGRTHDAASARAPAPLLH